MNFSSEWDICYAQNRHMSVWPWSDLVSLVNKYAHPREDTSPRVLEVGCGAGANISFLRSLKFDYYGIDGSSTIISSLLTQYPDLNERLAVADFTTTIPFDGEFELVVDRSSITHNHEAPIRNALSLIFQKLTRPGIFIGIDWFSTLHSEYHRGLPGKDAWTRTGYTSGPIGRCRERALL